MERFLKAKMRNKEIEQLTAPSERRTTTAFSETVAISFTSPLRSELLSIRASKELVRSGIFSWSVRDVFASPFGGVGDGEGLAISPLSRLLFATALNLSPVQSRSQSSKQTITDGAHGEGSELSFVFAQKTNDGRNSR